MIPDHILYVFYLSVKKLANCVTSFRLLSKIGLKVAFIHTIAHKKLLAYVSLPFTQTIITLLLLRVLNLLYVCVPFKRLRVSFSQPFDQIGVVFSVL